MTEHTHEIAKRIRSLREDNGVSIEEMARATSRTPEVYASLESGEHDLTFTFIYKCASKLGVDVVDLLTSVFLDDPLMSAIAAAAPEPRAALGHLHRVELAAHYLAADPAARADSRVDLAVDAASGEPLGVALWDAPSSTDVVGPLGPGDEPPPGLDPDLLGGAWELCLLDAAQCEAHRPAEPHWYLYMVAVAPAARGRGIGGRLLGHGLKRVDAEGLPAHLESTTPGSRRLYERFGFRQVAELAGSGLPVYWAMTRSQRGSGLG